MPFVTREQVSAALREVNDPEVGIDVVELGLVNEVDVDPATGCIWIDLTLTTPSCPAGGALVEGIRRRLLRIPGATQVEVELTFDPPWTPERIGPAGRARLGW